MWVQLRQKVVIFQIIFPVKDVLYTFIMCNRSEKIWTPLVALFQLECYQAG